MRVFRLLEGRSVFPFLVTNTSARLARSGRNELPADEEGPTAGHPGREPSEPAPSASREPTEVRLFRRVAALVAAAVVALVLTFAAAAQGPSRITKITAAGGNTCVLTNTGAAKCWGYNAQGQLGNGSVVHSAPTPVDVKGLTQGVREIALGGAFGCAVTTAGGVRCWGSDYAGQLGNGAAPSSRVPGGVKGLASGIRLIAAGGNHACAVSTQGSVTCWGSNANGQLGNGSSAAATQTPVAVVELGSGVRAIAAGGIAAGTGGFTCAVTATGGVKCWGDNPGNEGVRGCCARTPVDVTGLGSGVKAIAAGSAHACAVTGTGSVKCWGSDNQEQLGNGPTSGPCCRAPVDVVGLTSGVKAVTAGQAHTCALTNAGGVKCWGFNRHGQVGNGRQGDAGPTSPVNVVGLGSAVTAIAAGQAHTCALLRTGRVKCWGNNQTSQLGNASVKHWSTKPVDVVFPR